MFKGSLVCTETVGPKQDTAEVSWMPRTVFAMWRYWNAWLDYAGLHVEVTQWQDIWGRVSELLNMYLLFIYLAQMRHIQPPIIWLWRVFFYNVCNQVNVVGLSWNYFILPNNMFRTGFWVKCQLGKWKTFQHMHESTVLWPNHEQIQTNTVTMSTVLTFLLLLWAVCTVCCHTSALPKDVG